MNTFAIIKRILIQFRRDKRSVALMIMAPLLVLTLMWVVLDNDDTSQEAAAVDLPAPVLQKIEESGLNIKEMSLTEAEEKLDEASIDAMIEWQDGQPAITIEGSQPSAATSIQRALSKALGGAENEMQVDFYHGSDKLTTFDYTGPVLIGFFVFFFVFIVGGVSFLRERTQGTLDRLLASPIKRSELVFGYLGGFGLFTILQSILIAAYSIFILNMYMDGHFFYVILITFMLALTALSLGTLLSAYAKNEFQMIQFIPLVIVPQVFFSGLFPTEGMAEWLQAIGKVMPLTYGADALRGIMIRNEGLLDIQVDMYILLGFIILFTALNIAALKQHRSL